MVKKVLLICSGAVVAAGVFYMARISPSPKPQFTQGAMHGAGIPAVASLCVQPVANYAKRPLDMEGLDAALVSELKKLGLPAESTAARGGGCDAFVYTEITEVGGRGRKHAEVEFRLVSKEQVPPRLSSTARGKSRPRPPADNVGTFTPVGKNSFTAAGPAATAAAIEREAIVTAFAEQARQIAAVQRGGVVTRASTE